MNEWTSFYNEQTGEISNQRYRGPAVKENCPPGHKPIVGKYDCTTQIVDLETGEVVIRPASVE